MALSPSEAQDIRYAKAMGYMAKEEKKLALQLLQKNIDGPFHYESLIFLARYYYELNEFTKSFRLYQYMIKKTYNEKIVSYAFNPRLKSNFLEMVNSLEQKPSPLALKISFEVAEKYFEAFREGIFPREFSKSLLNLAEKYFLIAKKYDHYPALTRVYLSKIYAQRDQDEEASQLLREALSLYDEEDSKELGLLIEDIQVLLAESLAKQGHTDSGVILMRSLYSREEITPATRQYAKTFLKELNQSFFNAIFTYQLRQKQNANQLTSEDYENFENLPEKETLKKKDALFHHRRLDLFMNKQFSNEYHFTGNMNYLNESAFDSGVKLPNTEIFSFEAGLKKYRLRNSFYGLSYRFQNISGRRLETLSVIQYDKSQKVTPEYYWVTPNAKWKITLPLEWRTYNSGRSSSSLAIGFNYQPLVRSDRWSPSFYGNLGRRSEGEDFSSSLFYQLGLLNLFPINDTFSLMVNGDFYSNSNSLESLNYSELVLSGIIYQRSHALEALSYEYEFLFKRRSFGTQTIPTMEFGLGISYNF